MTALATHPVILLLGLWGLSALTRRTVLGRGPSPVPSGGIVMAGGIFVIAALAQLPLPGLLARLVVLELLVVWGYLALSYARDGLRGALELHRPVNTFAVGTWVAGSAVLGRALGQTLPGWQPVGLALWLVAVLLWVWYLGLLVRAFRGAAGPAGGYRATGAALLPVVATQSLAVAGAALLPGGLPGVVATGLLVAGYLFYACGLLLILRRYLRPGWTLADDWDDANCIIHGGASISGLAVVLTGALPGGVAVITWYWAALFFVVVEAIEVARARERVAHYGWREGLLSYLPTQWARNFTFGMFYAFTLQLERSPGGLPEAAGLARVVVTYGPYVVLALLLAEVAVFFGDRVRPAAKG